MKLILITFLALLMVSSIAVDTVAQVSQAGVIFLLLPPGARASGMGDAFTSIADDANATYWNPAGLGRYPLSPAWFEYPNNTKSKIGQIAIMDNGMPDNNYRKYDTWGLLGNKLARFNGEKWVYGEMYYPFPGENAEDIVRRFSGVDNDDSIKVLRDKLAVANNKMDKSEVYGLSNRIKANIPADYAYIDDIKYSLETLVNAWAELTLDPVKFDKLVGMTDKALQDDSLTADELDKLTFAINGAVKVRLPEKIDVPYDFVLPDTLTTLTSDAKDLWVGTPTGLYKYNGKRWVSYSTADSLISNDVTDVAFAKMRTVWIGTSEGISKYNGRKWISYTTENGLPSNRILDIEVGKRNDIWVITDSGLAKYQGGSFLSYANYTLNVGEDLQKAVCKYIHLKPGPALDEAVKIVSDYNAFGDSVPEKGTKIKIPYTAVIKGDIKSIYIDSNDNLWVATTDGLAGFDGKAWSYYGFKEYSAKQGDTPESIARNLLGKAATDKKVQQLAVGITSFNNLESSPINAGEILYIPSSPLATEILAVGGNGSNKVIVGTNYGTFIGSGNNWKRYTHANLDEKGVVSLVEKDGEVWLATPDELVVAAHAKREMSFMHSNWLVELANDIYFEYLSYVQHIEGVGTMGGAITFLSYGSQQRTGEQGEDLGTFFSYEMALAISYGTRVSDKLSLGMSAKYIHSHLSDVGAGQERGSGTASSFAVDGGMLWNTPVRKLKMGLSITNIGPDISYIDAAQADPLPRNLTLSLAYDIFKNPYNKLTLIGEGSKLLIGLTDFKREGLKNKIAERLEQVIAHIGAEYWYGTFLALRAGFVNDKEGDQRYYTLGAGLQYTNYRFDFSYIPSAFGDKNRLANTMRFSMTARF